MKPIIGIINRFDILPSGNKILYDYQEIVEKIIKSNGIPIGINIIENINDIKELIKNINGIIFQGGDAYTQEEIELVKYTYKLDIPTLGICQGMQIMGIATAGEIYNVKNHNKKNIQEVHEVILKKDTKIYEIIKKEKIKVNSRHNYAIKNTTLNISGYTKDNIIEVIEDKNKKFFIGIEWHPESLNNNDTKKIFDYFVNKAKEIKNDTKRNTKNNQRKNN